MGFQKIDMICPIYKNANLLNPHLLNIWYNNIILSNCLLNKIRRISEEIVDEYPGGFCLEDPRR